MFAFLQDHAQIVPAPVGIGIDRYVVQPLQEPCDFPLVEFLGFQIFGERLAGEIPVLFVIEFRSGGPDDTGGFRKLTGNLSVIERRQELAFGKVAGSSEDHVIERIDRNGLTAHRLIPHCSMIGHYII